MSVQLTIPYETLVELVDQLPVAEQTALLERLSQRQEKRLSAAEWKAQFESIIIRDVEINEAPSIRREDWYDDDGR